MNEERRIENIPIEKIIPNVYQPRIKFDNKSIEELSNSIKNHGIIQPLILRKIGEKYEIIDGERRYKAAKKANLTKLPSVVLDIEDNEAAELILTENMQKQLLTPIEEANAYQQIMLLNRFNIEQLAEKLGKEKNIIESKLKLLTLHPEIQEALLNNKISEGHAKTLTKISDREEQLDLFYKILKERITVKNLEELILNKKKKTEVEFMNNSQLNFNQYNNLLKEQEKPQMEATANSTAILGNAFEGPKPNDFFPSLEEQPLNAEVPVVNEQPVAAMEMPTFEVPNVETPAMMPQPEAQAMGVQQMMPEMPNPVELPQFEMSVQNNVQVPETSVAQEVAPVMVAPEPVMPTFEVPNVEAPAMMPQPEVQAMGVQQMMPEMPNPVELPQFEMPVQNNVQVPETSVAQEVAPVMVAPESVMPTFEVPNVEAPVMMPQAEVQAMGVQQMMPEMPNPVELPQFEMPVQNNVQVPETSVAQEVAPVMVAPEPVMPTFEVPSVEVPAMMPEVGPAVVIQPEVQVAEPATPKMDVVPAVNMIKSLMPLLENCGYKILLEEVDSESEYQVLIKVEK